MPEKEQNPRPRDVCAVHDLKCDQIKKLEQVWDHLALRPKTKTIVPMAIGLIALFGSLFGVSISLTQESVREAKQHSKDNQQKIEQNQKDITALMTDIRLTLKGLESEMKAQKEVQDKILKELKE